MEVIKTGKLNSCVLRLESALWIFGTHWTRGRTQLCGVRPGSQAEARKQCPECWRFRPKKKGYGIATRKHGGEYTFGLVELPADVLEQFEKREFVAAEMAGVTWEMKRRETRPGWEVLATERAKDHKPTPDWEIAAHMAVLFGLPEPWSPEGRIEVSSPAEFFDLHQYSIRSRLGRVDTGTEEVNQ